MDAQFKPRAVSHLTISLILLAGVLIAGFFWWQAAHHDKPVLAPMLWCLGLFAIHAPFYLTGCTAMARAKGYTGVLVVTCVLFWITSFIIVITLPDKLRTRRKRRRSGGRDDLPPDPEPEE